MTKRGTYFKTWSYVTIYLLLGSKILVASGLSAYDDSWDDHKNRNIRSEILYVTLRNKQVSSIFSTLAEVCPAQGNKGFGATWNGKHIVGVGKNVFEFNQKLGQWKEFVNTTKRREYSSCCTVGHSGIIVAGGWEESGKSSLEVLNSQNKPIKSRIEKIRIPFSLKKKSDDLRKLSWKKCPSKIPVSLNDGTPAQIWGHSITFVRNNTFIIIGGRALSQRPYRRETTRCVIQGEISEESMDITWKKLRSMLNDRFGHFSFKLKNFVYVAGGAEYGTEDILCCEVYDIFNDSWSISPHNLPYHLYKASVIVNEDETYALIIGGLMRTAEASENVIIFTEENGFEVFKDFSLHHKRYGHVSLSLK